MMLACLSAFAWAMLASSLRASSPSVESPLSASANKTWSSISAFRTLARRAFAGLGFACNGLRRPLLFHRSHRCDRRGESERVLPDPAPSSGGTHQEPRMSAGPQPYWSPPRFDCGRCHASVTRRLDVDSPESVRLERNRAASPPLESGYRPKCLTDCLDGIVAQDRSSQLHGLRLVSVHYARTRLGSRGSIKEEQRRTCIFLRW